SSSCTRVHAGMSLSSAATSRTRCGCNPCRVYLRNVGVSSPIAAGASVDADGDVDAGALASLFKLRSSTSLPLRGEAAAPLATPTAAFAPVNSK
ncbi:hypothetical protein GGF37_001541, partial [Kickxella alabastrina]